MIDTTSQATTRFNYGTAAFFFWATDKKANLGALLFLSTNEKERQILPGPVEFLPWAR